MAQGWWLPEDTVECILLKLPARSLVKFRCVCKSWNTLIRSWDFVNSHLHKTAAKEENEMIFMTLFPGTSASAECLDAAVPIRTPPGLDVRSQLISVIGDCNGLICLSVDRRDLTRDINERSFYSWNPTLGEYWMSYIPGGLDFFKPEWSVFGFGYDASIRDYKIVRLVIQPSKKQVEVELLVVGTRTLRKLENLILPDVAAADILFKSQPAIYAGGALHWFLDPIQCQSQACYSWKRARVISFDLAKEEFLLELILFPQDIEGISQFLHFGILGGKLFVVVRFDYSRILDDHEIWVMEEYGVNASWTKKMTLSFEPHMLYRYIFTPVCVTRNGNFLINEDHVLKMYNPEHKTYTLAAGHLESDRRLLRVAYRETLVSPLNAPPHQIIWNLIDGS